MPLVRHRQIGLERVETRYRIPRKAMKVEAANRAKFNVHCYSRDFEITNSTSTRFRKQVGVPSKPIKTRSLHQIYNSNMLM